jgi:DNA-binding GntR family transcriptional regulator
LHDQADRYRRFAAVASYPHRDELAEHTAVKEAALARDAATAAQLVRSHYERTAAIIAESIPQPGETPGDRTAA